MTTVMEKRIEVAEQEMQKNLVRLSSGTMDKNDVIMYAKKAVAEIDWSSSALMHKGISWIAKNYLRKIGYEVCN